MGQLLEIKILVMWEEPLKIYNSPSFFHTDTGKLILILIFFTGSPLERMDVEWVGERASGTKLPMEFPKPRTWRGLLLVYSLDLNPKSYSGF